MENFQKIGLLLAFVTITVVGCKGSNAGSHRWGGSQFGQGSIDRQKSRAVTFDPYPLNDIGPPIVGGRPREYANPLPEAARNELTVPQASAWAGYPSR
ncbi:MAG: hypothetical protein SGI77_11330 [Pirellulaceae bacterium]|nr:hypothetical protein [Pirellulaceae bacterium]